MVRLLAACTALVLLAGCGADEPASPPALPPPVPPANEVARTPQVREPWVAPGPQGGTTALFLTLTGGSVPDTLLGAAFAGAQTVEIHESYTTPDGLRGMRALRTVSLAAADTLVMEPGGLHVMLVSLREALAPGDTARVALRFARGGTVPVEAIVRAPR